MGLKAGSRFAALYFALTIAFCTWFSAPSRAADSIQCLNGLTCLDQGWTDDQRNWWYRTTQGSRLLPLSWMLSLELADSEQKFMSPEHMTKLGYLPEPQSADNPFGLPVGFTVDHDPSEDADIMCDTFPAACASGTMRTPWIGMNCSACHTNDVEVNGKRIRIEGAPTLADFQTFEEDLLSTLKTTVADNNKFERFALGVLGQTGTSLSKLDLKLQIAEQIEWQQKLADKNAAPAVRYGHGRLDAQGHILNKIALTTLLEGQPKRVLADAPASYPFVWNTSQQTKIQWNGIATNTFRVPGIPGTPAGDTDVGALIRNVSEVIGVFAHVDTTSKRAWRGYSSSARVLNLIGMERQLATLQSPRWPEDILGRLDSAKVARGKMLFGQLGCQGCHMPLEPQDITTKMTEQMDPIGVQRTDIFLACNTYLHRSKAGNFEGQKIFAFSGERIQPNDFTRNMLINATVGTIRGKLGELLSAAFVDVAPAPGEANNAPSSDDVKFLPGAVNPVKIEAAKTCLTAETAGEPDNILAYKARSLNGIWATAPYLHNGSVPTLYDLLNTSNLKLRSDETRPDAPAEQLRPDRFNVGSRAFDPVRVGFVTAPNAPGNAFEFNVRDASGNPIPGNYNNGHDYGTAALPEADRMALVEYLKSL
jgi:hypothetical protein